MPVALTYPGVYIEEIPSGVRTITGVSTSTTAFVGRALKGPVNTPVEVFNFGGFTRTFGGLSDLSPMSYSVQQYFLNGGQIAVIVRVANGAAPARFTIPAAGGAGAVVLEASSPGAWGDNLEISINTDTSNPANLFNIVVNDPAPPNGTGSGDVETIRNLSATAASPRFLTPLLEQQSRFLRLDAVNTVFQPNGDVDKPDSTLVAGVNTPITSASPGFTAGANGNPIVDADINDGGGATNKLGMFALEDADIFNILVIPPLEFGVDVGAGAWAAAAVYCRERRAFLIVDSPSGTIVAPATPANSGFTALTTGPLPGGNPEAQYAGYFFPRLLAVDPLTETPREFAASGAIAGIFARTDSARGVWKAPAGLEAGISGILGLSYPLTDDENGTLNQQGVNCLRTFKLMGSVVWGSRTVQGSDAIGSEWKYIPVRRLALFIEETLFRGTKWVVFEPNDETLWSQIRLNIGAFMQNLFRQGAFQGETPSVAYFVKCDNETTLQTDIDLGIVNILVGFAPLKPAEFVVIKIQQQSPQVPV